MSRIKNFGNKINTNGFDKRPENINRKGAKKKRYSEHIDEIKKMGYNAPTKKEYYEMTALLLSMTEDDLTEYSQDECRPYWIRLIIQDLDNKNSRRALMDSYRDWLFGKAEQGIKLSPDEKITEISINVKHSNEQ